MRLRGTLYTSVWLRTSDTFWQSTRRSYHSSDFLKPSGFRLSRWVKRGVGATDWLSLEGHRGRGGGEEGGGGGGKGES